MLMVFCGVGIVTLRTRVERDFTDFTERVQLVERVVNGAAAKLGQPRSGTIKYLVGGEVYVRALQGFGDHPPLRRQAQPAMPQPLQQ